MERELSNKILVGFVVSHVRFNATFGQKFFIRGIAGRDIIQPVSLLRLATMSAFKAVQVTKDARARRAKLMLNEGSSQRDDLGVRVGC